MDSFFSLFDPLDSQNRPKKQRHKKAETQADTAKKKNDQPKSRRSNKKNQGKNETLPEESSFLCDPNLSTDVLVKDGSYIESFIASNESYTNEANDKKLKRKNSNRKNRRKRNKISPATELTANTNGWLENSDNNIDVALNNKCNLKQKSSQEIGKNVNDLQKDVKKLKDHTQEEGRTETKDINSIIDNFERIGIVDEKFISEEFDYGNFNDFYSSDEMEGSLCDSSSDLEDSDEETFGSLPPEPRFGNVEYKLQLVNPSEKRFQHLVTQLKWRLRSGGGSAVYCVGVRDSGALRGLSAQPLRASLRTLRAMAGALNARVEHVVVRRVAARRAVAEVSVRKLADTQQSVELRVAVMGANEAGKSTLIGVLTQGELDNGRGSARLNMFRHVHEVRSGRTSSLSHEILGFDAQGNVVNYGCSELMTAERIGERSARLVSFLDLAGHHKYQRTTVHGLTGYSPHYAMLVVSATAGVSKMCEEHIGLLLALDLPFSIVVTKIDLAPSALDSLLDRIKEILDAAGCAKRPLLISDEQSARTCVTPPTLLLDSVPGGADDHRRDCKSAECVPVFPVSCVRGGGLNSLHAYLLALDPPSVQARSALEEEPCEFQIDEIFHVGESAGPVVGGLLARGRLCEGDDLLIGPLETGEFAEISVRSVYRNRIPCGEVKAGQSASLGLSAYPPNVRQGMVLIAVPDGYHHKKRLNCQYVDLKKHKPKNNIEHLVISKMSADDTTKKGKNRRTKDKNILQDLVNVENCLSKDITPLDRNKNLYHKSDSDSDKMETGETEGVEKEITAEGSSESEKENCECDVDAFAEDPSFPRGSLFFQATVRVLRHCTSICPGFQATVHIGNIRQTAVIEGIMSWNSVLRAGESAPVLFRFVRQPEYVRAGRTVLFRAGLGTRGVGRVSQAFPYPHPRH